MNLNRIVKKILSEVTSTSKNSEYISPLLPGYREFQKHINGPFTEYATEWDDPLLDHDSLDGKMSYSKKTIQKREKRAEKIANYIKNNPDLFAWDGDAGVINGLPSKSFDAKPIKNYDPKKTTTSLNSQNKKNKSIKEATSTSTNTKGGFVPPLQPGIRYFKKNTSGPFELSVSKYHSPDLEYDSYDGQMERTKKQIQKKEKVAIKVYNKIKNNPELTFSDEEGNVINQYPGKTETIVPIKEWVELEGIPLNEDLAVWFGKKKKPKGSKQPKGPWVNICRKVDGKHPPCGRPDTSKGAYPKCRASGVAGKMSDSAKKAACAQKRKAEKNDPQSGKGQKPVMTSYKPKKKRTQNESLEKIIKNILSSI
jgi:hypothetical protein